MVDDVNDDKIWNLSTHFTHNFNDKTRFILNVSYQNYKSDQYREIKDLLGGQYALNKDPYKRNGSGKIQRIRNRYPQGRR